jgi:CubicO group peptidase (beta-lactamase class C family)
LRSASFRSITLLAGTVVTIGLAAQPPPVVVASVAAAIERELRAARIPAASFAVVAADGSIARHYGLADAERGVVMTPATLMQVGSLNKLMTALALSATLEQQKIPYDDRIGAHVSDLHARLGAVTFHQLLSHTSGLRDHPGASGTNDEGALANRVRAITDGDFLLPAGTVFSYSNLGYAAAGLALEQLRNKPYADALREAALDPLLMRTSTMRATSGHGQPRAVGHRLDQSAVVTMDEIDNDTSIWPAGYLWTTAEEMMMLLRLMANGRSTSAEYRGVAVGLPQTVLTRVTSPHAAMPNVFAGGQYGYGLMLANDRGVRVYEHGGTQRGFSALLRVAPERRFGIVILTNLDAAPLRRIAQNVMAEALGLPAEKPATRSEAPVSPEEAEAFVGVYRNRGTAELAVRGGRLVLILEDGPPMVVSRIGEQRYLARPKPDLAGPEFVLQPAGPTAPAYLHFAMWAYVR